MNVFSACEKYNYKYINRLKHMRKLILTSQMGNSYLVFICLPDRYIFENNSKAELK